MYDKINITKINIIDLINLDLDSSNNTALDFVGRDFITRIPKTLGAIYLPKLNTGNFQITEVGNLFLKDIDHSYLFQRQLAKDQFYNPIKHHTYKKIRIRPLALFIYILLKVDYLTKTEIAFFVITILNKSKINENLNLIKKFRQIAKTNTGDIKKKKKDFCIKSLQSFYNEEISEGRIKIRENNIETVEKFLQKKI